MSRRGEADPLLLQAVSARLARLLAETPPRRAVDEDAATTSVDVAAQEAVPAPARAGPETELVEVDDVPPPRRFGRLHLGVVCLLLIAGLLGAGWSVLRARPVALAAPPTVSVSTTPSTGPATASTLPSPTPGPATPTANAVVVHVLGAVRRPGLVTLAERARVQDAVDAAGGFTRDADPGELNLAQLLQDGQQVVIGTAAHPAGEVRSGGAGGSGSGSGAAGSDSAGSGSSGAAPPLDLNAATEPQLEELPGVGPVTAGKIIAWRAEHGRFSRVEELREVDGIGPKTYAEIAPHVRV
ncbi:helix-hairpin-helix domain-containing protein [uncultured Friedmanniella sp.]|uniref:helix-hairpin-helix domain-containing protein n=1 Tax=uncultured Friedmanniella sp. TaxID=335381 RepID=UPI0035CAD35C